jgi:hypothetical protein
VAPLKIPLQVTCPNCQTGNLPGSPYCSRCGAPMDPQGQPSRFSTGGLRSQEADFAKTFTSEGQDPALAKQVHDKASQILTNGEQIEYIATGNRVTVGAMPECAVATNKRLIVCRKKMLGKLELDDCSWRDVEDAVLSDGRHGWTLKVSTIQGWPLAVEALPEAQAIRLHEHAMKFSERLRNRLGQAAATNTQPVPPVQQSQETVPQLPDIAAVAQPIRQMPTTPPSGPLQPQQVPAARQSGPLPAPPVVPTNAPSYMPASSAYEGALPPAQRQQTPVQAMPAAAAFQGPPQAGPQIVDLAQRAPQPLPGTGPFATRQSAPLNGNELPTRPMTGPLQGVPQSAPAGTNGANPAGIPRPIPAAANATRANQGKAATDDPVRKMKQLKEMLEAGLITEADFQQKKLDILSRI